MEEALDALIDTPLFAGIVDGMDRGFPVLTATMPTSGPVAKVIEKTTMPDGQLAVKLQIVKD